MLLYCSPHKGFTGHAAKAEGLTRAGAMQVCKCDWDEGTWVISLDDFSCFSKGRRGKKRSKKCDPGASFRRDKMVKQRKSVSFDDDVMVYLFDQERPTMKLLSGPPSPLSDAYDCNLTEVPEEGLEWDDDFSAVEMSSHFQHGRRSASEFPTPPTPGRFLLSQRCLFLTHVTESDLTELQPVWARMEKLTNRPDLTLLTSKPILPTSPPCFMMSQGF
ncbi:uncharacterized protein LOC142893774 isoform X5 [Nelusetta ayraudi]|uniref:uncharacterized protein LOC142893774 isoform X5 n=1 Tax=Nelusetta ayraudi TaxID=303726 RepID=UPI003F71131F